MLKKYVLRNNYSKQYLIFILVDLKIFTRDNLFINNKI